MQKLIKSMTGYKATDKNMKCHDHQFELGEWYEVAGELEECKNGFHFCEQPSGVWSYYGESSTRVFKVEAEDVLDTPFVSGTDYTRVCRRIRLTKEILLTGDYNAGDYNAGDYNTGNYNTGDCNTGYRNTGDCNTGDYNAGDYNAGDYNTGYRNTGDCNTGNSNIGDCNTGNYNTGDRNTGNYNAGNSNIGYRNTGYRNTGYCNTGDYNAGYRNTGDCNTGYRNTGNSNIGDYNAGNYNIGDYNAGYGNVASYCAGFLCVNTPPVVCFDEPVLEITREEFVSCYGGKIRALYGAAKNAKPVRFKDFKDIPNITAEKLKAYQYKLRKSLGLV